MAKPDILASDIRQKYDNYKLAKKAGWEQRPIRQWGPYEYIVYDSIDLRLGAQTITVIDITGTGNVARFQMAYPEQGFDDEHNQALRRYALVLPPEEGIYWLVMREGETNTSFDNAYYATSQFYAADLTIFVCSSAAVEIDEMIGDIAWAVKEAQSTGWKQEEKQIANSIRAAAKRGAIAGTRQGKSNRWYFDKGELRDYLRTSQAETRGRPAKIEDLITSGADAHTIQRTLAALTREATGKIPHVQLWQPCDHPDCTNEPVCGNCLMCQDEHCDCFDQEES